MNRAKTTGKQRRTTSQTRKVLELALQLPEKERWNLTNELLESLDGGDRDPDYEAAWSAEIERRIKDLDSGKAKTIPWEEVRRSILGLSARHAKR